MTECNAIIKANNEIDKLKRENEKLNELCVQYGFEMGKLEEENKQLKQQLSQAKVNHKGTQKVSLLEENRLLRKVAENLEDTDWSEELEE